MASFSVPCPKTSALSLASKPTPTPNQHQQLRHSSISFRSDPKSKPALLAGSSSDHSASLRFQGSRWNQSDSFRVCAQLNEVAIEKSSNSIPFPEKETEEPAQKSESQSTIPDASSISAFMSQVADLVELVDSKDIMELQLKQLDCELLIRKKEALPQPPAPVVMMHSPPPQAMVPSQLPPPQLSAPAPAGPAPAPAASEPAPTPAKPQSSHPPLKCPMAGTFYRCPAPGAPPFVKVGDKVQKGQVVCIIEAMKLMNEIETDQAGTIVEIIAEDGKPVSVDTPLFTIEP